MKLKINKRISRRMMGGSLGILCGIVLLSSCGEKKEKAPEAPETPKLERKVATPEQRAEKLGLLSLVPADATIALAVYDLPYFINSVKDSNTGRYLANKGAALDPADAVEVVDVEVETSDVATGGGTITDVEAARSGFPVKDVVIAGGPGQIKLLNALAKDYGLILKPYYQAMARNIQANINIAGRDAGLAEVHQIMQILPQMELLSLLDFESSDAAAPLMIMADLDENVLADVKMSINQYLPMAMMVSKGIVTPYSAKKGDIDFSGVSVDGQLLAQLVKQQGANIPGVDQATIDRVAANIAKGKLYIAIGYKGNTMITIVCTNPDKQLDLPATPADSILGKAGFVDQHIDKKTSFVCYGSPEYTQAMMDYYKTYYVSDRDAVMGMVKTLSEPYPNDKPLANKLMVSISSLYDGCIEMINRYDASAPMTCHGWFDQGLNIEMTCGDSKMYDWGNPVIYSGIVGMPDAAVAVAASITDSYIDSNIAILESTAKTLWYSAELVDNNYQGEDLAKFREFFQKAREIQPGIVKLWDTGKGLRPAYGNQGAIVMDFKGTMSVPAQADIPSELALVAQHAALPRISSIRQLKDRSKLAPAWSTVKNTVNENLTKLGLTDARVGDPVSEQKDGYTSYFYQFKTQAQPANNKEQQCAKLARLAIDQNTPAITVSDSLYVTGSLPLNYLAAQAASQPAAQIVPAVYGPLGLYMRINTAPFAKAAQQWEKACPDNDDLSDIKDFLDALSKDIKGMGWTSSFEDGKVINRFQIETTK